MVLIQSKLNLNKYIAYLVNMITFNNRTTLYLQCFSKISHLFFLAYNLIDCLLRGIV